MTDEQIQLSLDKLIELLSGIEDGEWDKENLENILAPVAEDFGKEISGVGNKGYLLWPLRAAITGKQASAGPFEVAEILGKEKTLKRLQEAKKIISI